MVIAILYFNYSSAAGARELGRVKEITLSPTNVAIPAYASEVWEKTPFAREHRNLKYVTRKKHLYHVENGAFQEVTGDMPLLVDTTTYNYHTAYFSWFIDVTSSEGIKTYAAYPIYPHAKFSPYVLETSDLYGLNGDRIKKLISHIREGAFNKLDCPLAISAYLDKRGNLFVLTDDGMLYVIRDSQIIAKADVAKLGAEFSSDTDHVQQ